MSADLDLPIEIVTCPTVREPDGLALTRGTSISRARNVRRAGDLEELRLAGQLVAEGQHDAAAILERMTALLVEADLKIDYVAVWPIPRRSRRSRRSIAARSRSSRHASGATRLIDNDWIG